MPVAIRPMTPGDLDPAVAAVLDGGWGDRRTWFEFALAHPACDPLVAVDEADGTIVATGTGTTNGRSGWVGTIFVVPSRRREGIGLAVSAAVCERLEALGCRTLLLVASEEGRPVYERLGFEEDGWYRTFEADGTGGGATAAGAGAAAADGGSGRAPTGDPREGIRSFAAVDIDEAAELDRGATGEDRRHLIEAFASVPRGLALRDSEGALGGYVLRAPWGGGATVARSVEEAERLLAARRASVEPGHRVRAGLLEPNQAGVTRLDELGWTELRRILRMRRGPALDRRAEMIWGQFNFALG